MHLLIFESSELEGSYVGDLLYPAFWEALRKFHHQLCRQQEKLKSMSLTYGVPWPSVAAKGSFSAWRSWPFIPRSWPFISRVNFRERLRREDFEGLMWLGGDSDSAGNTLWLLALSGGNGWVVGMADTLSLPLDETNPLIIFPLNYMVLLPSWKAKLQSLSRLVTLALKIRNN